MFLDVMKAIAYILILSIFPPTIVNTARMARLKGRDPLLYGTFAGFTFFAIYILYQLTPKDEPDNIPIAMSDQKFKKIRDFPAKICLGGICLVILVFFLKTY